MEFILSNSKLHDYQDMCPLEFKAKHIDKNYPAFEPTEPMEYGNWFETLVIGGGINGAFDFDKSPHGEKMKRSVFFDRVKQQAEIAKDWLKKEGGKVASRQEYIRSEITDRDGQVIPIEGTLDIRYEWPGTDRRAVIDLKFTTDTENDFGKFAWGSPEKMDLSQIIHYGLLIQLEYGGDYPETKYWIFDSKADMRKKRLDVRVSPGALADHIQRLSETYNQVTLAIAMDDWTPKNTYENCSKCQAKCDFEKIIPDYHIIEL